MRARPHQRKFRRRRSSPHRQTPQRWWCSCGVLSDVRISLTGNFSSSHETTTNIFSSHRFTLVGPINPRGRSDGEGHFTVGFIYTGTLVFFRRSYDHSTAFTIPGFVRPFLGHGICINEPSYRWSHKNTGSTCQWQEVCFSLWWSIIWSQLYCSSQLRYHIFLPLNLRQANL